VRRVDSQRQGENKYDFTITKTAPAKVLRASVLLAAYRRPWPGLPGVLDLWSRLWIWLDNHAPDWPIGDAGRCTTGILDPRNSPQM